MTMYMVCCTNVILNEIQQGLSQKQIASSYGMALLSASAGVDEPDWSVINKAIIDKWSFAALDRIKVTAWKLAQGKAS